MKKILLASTALVLSAGFAAADVDLSGSAEMGIVGGDDIETQFHTDIDVTFSMSGTTDTGLTFGASIDLDESDGDPSAAFDADTQGGETIFISSESFGTVTMGDTDGAFDAALQEAIIGGAIADDHEHAGYNGNAGFDGGYDGQIVRYDSPSFGGFSVHGSMEIDDSGADDAIFALGAVYSGEFSGVDVRAGLGYQSSPVVAGDEATIIGVSASASASGFTGIFNYSAVDADATALDPTHVGLALGYEVDALTVAINWGSYDEWVLVADPDQSGFGLVVNYDLGGGAEAQFGYGSSDAGGDTTATYSLGLAFSF